MATAISRDSILVVAQQLGLDAGGEETPLESSAGGRQAQKQQQRPSLSLDAASILAPDAEYRIREVIQVASKIMRRARRETLTVDDVNAALQMRRTPQLFGYSRAASASAAVGRDVSAGSGDAPGGIRFARPHGAPGVYFVEDRVLSVSDILDADLPPLPREIEATVHWLAVEGVVPRIPQNATNGDEAHQAQQRRVVTAGADAQALLTTARSGGGALAPAATASAMASGQSALAALLSVTTPGAEIEIPHAGDSTRSMKKRKITLSTAASLAAHTDKEHLTREHVRPTVEHVLSRELQLYYENLMRAMVQTENDSITFAALESLRNDAGVSQLVPYMVQFVVDEVAHSVTLAARASRGEKPGRDGIGGVAAELGLTPFRRIQRALTMCRALFGNHTLFLEPYLHQLMPALLTCAVGKQVAPSDMDDDMEITQWDLRDAATELVAEACSKHGQSYANLRPRVAHTYTLAFAMEEAEPIRPACSHYGAIRGLTQLGHRAVSEVLFPTLATSSYADWLSQQDQASEETGKIRNALERAVETWMVVRVQDPDISSAGDEASALRAIQENTRDLYETLASLIGINGIVDSLKSVLSRSSNEG